MPQQIQITKGTTGPTISDQIVVDGVPVSLAGATVKFRMREVQSTTLKVDATASIDDAPTGKVSYDLSATDTSIEGDYRWWWNVTIGTRVMDTPEYVINIDSHAPGIGVTLGAVARNARQQLPMTWDGLSQDRDRFGDNFLAERINYIKFRLFGTSIDASLEATAYDPFVLDFMGRMAALSIIPAGIDYWATKPVAKSLTGTQESVSYPDRIRALEKTAERLTASIIADKPDIEAIIPLVLRRRGRYPKVSTTGPLITADPQDFFPEFGEIWDSRQRNYPIPFIP